MQSKMYCVNAIKKAEEIAEYHTNYMILHTIVYIHFRIHATVMKGIMFWVLIYISNEKKYSVANKFTCLCEAYPKKLEKYVTQIWLKRKSALYCM